MERARIRQAAHSDLHRKRSEKQHQRRRGSNDQQDYKDTWTKTKDTQETNPTRLKTTRTEERETLQRYTEKTDKKKKILPAVRQTLDAPKRPRQNKDRPHPQTTRKPTRLEKTLKTPDKRKRDHQH